MIIIKKSNDVYDVSNDNLILFLGITFFEKYELFKLSAREKIDLTFLIRNLYKNGEYYENELDYILNIYKQIGSNYNILISKLVVYRRINKINKLLNG